ncbi:MaoC/PaaZ C-terminal domain-containing protein [Dyadobacter arcticus]|uniref:MaoC-like domain-containing protein n=1 Tax=Dyadobacter arcticus TaxID=1078754 RepID=A0ABX0ULJ3_9BACT|nr:MaoC/PaaZ C-terminal domain-containing protein [Dyadobacter arcticus]NIJ52325.1 hypothetical protein [Dyadobacter arcticus]
MNLKYVSETTGAILFNQEDLDIFASISGDENPIHLDIESAKKLGFHDTIVPGGLVSLIIMQWVSRISNVAFEVVEVEFLHPIFPCLWYTVEWLPQKKQVTVRSQREICLFLNTHISSTTQMADNNHTYRNIKFPPNIISQLTPFLIQTPSAGLTVWLEMICLISYLSGMIYPGKSSILRDFRLHIKALTSTKQLKISLFDNNGIGAYQKVAFVSLCDSNIIASGHYKAISAPVRRHVLYENYPFLNKQLNGEFIVLGASRGLGASLTIIAAKSGATTIGFYKTSSKSADMIRHVGRVNKLNITMRQVDCSNQESLETEIYLLKEQFSRTTNIVLTAFPEFSLLDDSLESEEQAIKMSLAPLKALHNIYEEWRGNIIYVSTALINSNSSWNIRYTNLKLRCENILMDYLSNLPNAGLVILRLPIYSSDRTAFIGGIMNLPDVTRAAMVVLETICTTKIGCKCVIKIDKF